MPPFLMTIVSASDHWLFVASNGGLTAGRVDADRALFPYQAVDRIYDTAASAGPFTCLHVTHGEQSRLWEPFHAAGRRFHRLSRNLYKSIEGNRLIFEETNQDLGLTFSAEWTTSERFGFVRRVRLANDGFSRADVRVVDGLRNLLPAGIPRRLQDSMSCLADAYKRSEVVAGTSLAVFALSVGITDQPVPLESLLATVAWSDGLTGARVLLTERQLDAFRGGILPQAEADVRGVRGVYAVAAELVLEAGDAHAWQVIADEGWSQSGVVALAERLRAGNASGEVRVDIDAGTQRLREIVGGADGLQSGGDETTTAHHFANVLFNVMRGGACLRGYGIRADDFARFVGERNHGVARGAAPWLADLPSALSRDELGERVRRCDSADLERLFLEYLPLGFSRRHGDPSRPWNRFSIRLRDEAGREVFEYEGNWRDIFQNWEALGTAYPEFLEHMVAKFVNASTLDGHNPYRVTRRGVEWEVPAPDDPWAGIGYWGDHQIVYLLKLLEWAEHFAPGRFHQWLERPVFSYTAVPYRIVSYEEMRRHPRATITFQAGADALLRSRERNEGTDARLVRGPDGGVWHVTLLEKLLVTALARLANLIPGGGIWMNTQRPEWNDANNALVGFGVSGVTLCYLRRYLRLCRRLVADRATTEITLSSAVAGFVESILEALRFAAGREGTVAVDARERRAVVDRLAGAGSRYREAVYAQGPGGRRSVPTTVVLALCDAALPLVEASLCALRRPDGLYHAYCLLHFPDARTLPLDDLPLMLEGQVAALASGFLEPEEAVALLRALRASPLYRADQHSYLLYPDGNPPGFLERNVVPTEVAAGIPLLGALLDAGDHRLVRRDARGTVRFRHDLVNAAALEARLAELARDETWSLRVKDDADAVRTAFEHVFSHRAFTGRSGAMFAYEGLGSVYWHMVSKLLLATQQAHVDALEREHPAAEELAEAYFDIRAGLGFNKQAASWGAFPTDPYSHTPGHAGAQQPGMTGQVKEGVLARLGELGVLIRDGVVAFRPSLLRASEFAAESRSFTWFDAIGRERRTVLPAAALAFTLCGTLVVYRLIDGEEVTVTVTRGAEGRQRLVEPILPAGMAAELFARSGSIERIEVTIGRWNLSGTAL